jgi:hypothetical protein
MGGRLIDTDKETNGEAGGETDGKTGEMKR